MLILRFAPLLVVICLAGCDSATDSTAPDRKTNPSDETTVKERDALAQDARWGSLATRFVYHGDPPKARTFRITKDNEAFGDTIGDESFIVNAKGRGIANVVVYLLPANNEELSVHPSYDDTANTKTTLMMRRGRFEPHVLLMRTSQTMIQKNTDRVGHHARIHFVRNTPM